MAKGKRYLTSMFMRYRSHYSSFRVLLILALVVAVLFIYKYHSNNRQTAVSDDDGRGDDIDKLMGEVVRKLNLQKPADGQHCAIPHLNSPAVSPGNASCRRIQPIRGSCQLANDMFLSTPKESCDHQQYQTICEYEEMHNAIKCYNDVCDPEKPVSIATTSPDLGTLHWRSLPSIAKLQDLLRNMIDPKSRQHHFGFIFIRCPKLRDEEEKDDEDDDESNTNDTPEYEYNNDDEAYEDDLILAGKHHLVGINVYQLLILPPKIINQKAVHTNKYIDVNVVMLDSISRHHFFRSLPNTVQTMKEINRRNASTVLDFELLQSLKGRTYENLMTFFAGEIYDVAKPFGVLDMPHKPLKTEAMLEQFKKHGYHTSWFEDLCWTWEWGLVKDLLAMDRDLELADRWKKFKDALQTARIDRYDVTLSSCEMLRVNHHHDPFHGPEALCYRGKHQHEYILQYVKYFQSTMAKLKQPYFNNLLLNTGHEDTGRRVQTLDDALADYVEFLTKQENTLTIMYADHGNAYGEFIEKTEEGRIELYNPFLIHHSAK
ncbi:uncharacterized protein [Ptychodera flava]|uniref:uncharacterized protein n=1 Tax=Ptychodera flava TaxID=63121 RepID=UPI00396A1342